jgi:hypothetical protein
MARNRKRKTAIGSFSEKDMEDAMRLVVQNDGVSDRHHYRRDCQSKC